MLGITRARNRPDAGRRTVFGHQGCIVTTLLAIALLWPWQGFCDLYIEFLVDRSGSMWAPFQGKPKIVQVADAVERIAQKLPTDVAIKRRIGYLPEDSYLYRFLNARETLDYYGRLFHLDRRTRNARIDTLLDMVGLKAVQRRPVGEYSKGMQRRIGLAQALINDPDLLILDEPTTGMDPIGTRQIKDLIVELRSRGKTVLLCSHLLSDVEDVCDRVTVLYGGRVRVEGAVDDLLKVSGSLNIETDALSDATLDRVRAVIAEEDGKSVRRVEAPRQRLESLFLEIVEQAQAEGVETSGAQAGGQVADFLGDGAADQTSGDALIDQLVGGDPKPQPAPPDAESDDDAAAQDASVDEQVLSDLQSDAPKTPSPDEPSAPAAEPEQADRGVIDDLLGGGDDS
jgi:ABC-2 type transport system ATP-binding protein